MMAPFGFAAAVFAADIFTVGGFFGKVKRKIEKTLRSFYWTFCLTWAGKWHRI
jgi:hypothetical protein